MFRLDDKVAIVTGASRGIGAAISVGLAEAGANLILVSRTPPQVEVIQALEQTGRKFTHCSADLTKMPSIAPIIELALSHFGRIDILVNNAGIIRRTPFLDQGEQDWDEVLNVNLKVPVFLGQACARQMVKQGHGGKIINICSILSFQGGWLVGSYTASKHGLAGVTKSMANELAQYQINVNAIAPGYITTDATTPLRHDADRSRAIVSRTPVGRWGEPSDVVGAAVFLASPASNYMQGHIMAVDGGWMGR